VTGSMTSDAPGAAEEPDGDHGLALRMHCPAVLSALRTVRQRVQRWARGHGLPDDVLIDLQLTVGEAVSNGVEHAYPGDGAARGVDVDLRLRHRGDAAVVAACVTDRGRWRPPPADPGHRGRGLALIDELAQRLTVRPTGSGTRVSFEIPVGAAG